jgi:glycosyltransferase involved in cell wall biosynthesis
MKILSINKFHRRSGGAETYMFSLTELLGRMGHEVIPFSMLDERNEPSCYSKYFVPNVDYHRNRSLARKVLEAGRIFYSFDSKRHISALIRDTKPSLAHCHNIYHQLSPSILHTLKQHCVPIVLTAHDYKLLCGNYKMLSHGRTCERCCHGSHYHATLQRCVKNSLPASVVISLEMYFHRFLDIYSLIDVIIAPSCFLKSKLIQYGFPAEKVIQVPYFVDPVKYQPCYENQGYFLYLGRLVEEKGLKTLLAAMKSLRNKKLWVLGDGPQRTELEELANKYHLDNLSFRGFLTGRELVNAVENASFIVLPPEWYENYPLAILEAFAMGKPVVASRIGGIPELIDDGKEGFLFTAGDSEDLAQKIDCMLSDPRKLVEMGKAARSKILRCYTPEQHYKGIKQVYNSLVSA